jgi:hypoxanthine-DNA glycosylase
MGKGGQQGHTVKVVYQILYCNLYGTVYIMNSSSEPPNSLDVFSLLDSFAYTAAGTGTGPGEEPDGVTVDSTTRSLSTETTVSSSLLPDSVHTVTVTAPHSQSARLPVRLSGTTATKRKIKVKPDSSSTSESVTMKRRRIKLVASDPSPSSHLSSDSSSSPASGESKSGPGAAAAAESDPSHQIGRRLSAFSPVIAELHNDHIYPLPRVLILGSAPSRLSITHAQYYGNKQNHFWRITANVFGYNHSLPYEERLEALKRNGVALWDVIAEFERAKNTSSDTDLQQTRVNDFASLLREYPSIQMVACNGGKAYTLFNKHFNKYRFSFRVSVIQLPSSSPAHAMKDAVNVKTCKWRKLLAPVLIKQEPVTITTTDCEFHTGSQCDHSAESQRDSAY